MRATLYINKSETNKVDKNLTEPKEYTITLRDRCSALKPVIQLTSATALVGYNYLYIPYFKRYYFIDNITSVRTGVWEIEASVDVLQTYSAEIKKQTAVIARQENVWDLYLDDPLFTITDRPRIQVQEFPNKFDNEPNFILVLAGPNAGSAPAV